MKPLFKRLHIRKARRLQLVKKQDRKKTDPEDQEQQASEEQSQQERARTSKKQQHKGGNNKNGNGRTLMIDNGNSSCASNKTPRSSWSSYPPLGKAQSGSLADDEKDSESWMGKTRTFSSTPDRRISGRFAQALKRRRKRSEAANLNPMMEPPPHHHHHRAGGDFDSGNHPSRDIAAATPAASTVAVAAIFTTPSTPETIVGSVITSSPSSPRCDEPFHERADEARVEKKATEATSLPEMAVGSLVTSSSSFPPRKDDFLNAGTEKANEETEAEKTAAVLVSPSLPKRLVGSVVASPGPSLPRNDEALNGEEARKEAKPIPTELRLSDVTLTPSSTGFKLLIEEEKHPIIREVYSRPDMELDADYRNHIAKTAAILDKSGNDLFEQGHYEESLMRYERALFLKKRSLQQEEQKSHPNDHECQKRQEENQQQPTSPQNKSMQASESEAFVNTNGTAVAGVQEECNGNGNLQEVDTAGSQGERNSENHFVQESETANQQHREQTQKKSILASVATSINNMTYLKHRAGVATADETMASYMKSLAIKREILGPEHLSVGKTLNNIGSVFFLKREFEPALAAYRDAYRIMKDRLGPSHLDVVTVKSNIGDVHYSKGEWDEALIKYREAVQIRWGILGPKHPKVTRLMEQIAQIETGRQPCKESSDSEAEDFKEEDRRRDEVFREDIKALQEEIEEDMKFFEIMERQTAIDMVRDRTRLIREMREYNDSLEAIKFSIDEIAEDIPGVEKDEEEENVESFQAFHRSISSRLTQEERQHALSLIKKRVEELRSMRSQSSTSISVPVEQVQSMHSQPAMRLDEHRQQPNGNSQSMMVATSSSLHAQDQSTNVSSFEIPPQSNEARQNPAKLNVSSAKGTKLPSYSRGAPPSYMRPTVSSAVKKARTPQQSSMTSQRNGCSARVQPSNRMIEEGIRALQRAVPSGAKEPSKPSSVTTTANLLPQTATATG